MIGSAIYRRKNMIYRTLTENDTEAFFEMMCRLDEETE